jgi:GDP-mannose 4,6-dehydratase
MRKAVITGITGQDGSYLADFLMAKGYEIHGLKRRSSSFNTDRVDHLYEDLHKSGARFFLHYADLSDASSLAWLLADLRPDEVYNLGAQSHVKVSFEVPEYTGDVVAMGTLRLLEAIRRTGIRCRFYQASSSEMFGSTPPPQNEASTFHPRSPYACAKVFAHHHYGELPGELRPACLLRHPVQPRIAPPRRDVRDPQDHPRRGPYHARDAGEAVPGEPGRPSATGVMPVITWRPCG